MGAAFPRRLRQVTLAGKFNYTSSMSDLWLDARGLVHVFNRRGSYQVVSAIGAILTPWEQPKRG